jgi:Ca-activated chloride channel family protein
MSGRHPSATIAPEVQFMARRRRVLLVVTLAVSMITALAACGGGAATPSPVSGSATPILPSGAPAASGGGSSAGTGASAGPTASEEPSGEPSSEAGTDEAPASAGTSSGPTGPATLDAASEVGAGAQFQVTWTGPAAKEDYVALMAAGAAKWTTEPYFAVTAGSPAPLVAPTAPGFYELWYVQGSDGSILARRGLTITPFQGSLDAAPSVSAGTTFPVSWTGPNGPNDYITIVKPDVARWTTESYAYTHAGNPVSLVSPIEPGAYELRYVTGADDLAMARRPITVAPMSITLKAPASVTHSATFQVSWTGPDGPSDYVTIVPVGSPVGTYASFAYTANGSPVTLDAPAEAGKYEIWYASDRVAGVFARIPIEVK